jgi:hypothetical protein
MRMFFECGQKLSSNEVIPYINSESTTIVDARANGVIPNSDENPMEDDKARTEELGK